MINLQLYATVRAFLKSSDKSRSSFFLEGGEGDGDTGLEIIPGWEKGTGLEIVLGWNNGNCSIIHCWEN